MFFQFPERKLRIGLEMMAYDVWIAGTIYLRNLIYCMASLPRRERPEIRILGESSFPAIEELLSFDFVDRWMPPASTHSSPPRSIARGDLFRRWFRMKNSDGMGLDVTYPSFGDAIPGVPQMHWIPDFQHAHLSEFFSPEEVKARSEGIERITNKTGIIVLSSHVVLRDFQRLYPDATIIPRVWSFCTVLTDREKGGRNPHEAFGLPEKYLYLPNQFWVHKDHKTAFQAICMLKERGMTIPLVCTGYQEDHRDLEYYPSLIRCLSEWGIQDQVRILGLIPRKDQIEVFRHAAAVLQPSLFEGWSTVVEDAKSIGRPLILSDLEVHREQVNSNAWFFRRSCPEDLRDILERLWPQLKPGPDKGEEKAAGKLTEKRRLAAAREFLKIVREATKLFRGELPRSG